MRNYVIINGVNSLDIQGLAINNLPPITKPMIRTQREEIDGRDGDIVTELGYSAYDKQMEIGLYGNYDINDIIKYFTGEGTITFSNEADKYYNFKILDQIDYEKLLKFKTAVVTFHCQPFKYPVEETPVEGEAITVTGSGANITLENTVVAPMDMKLKGNTIQDGTPTPSSPIPVQVVSGDNSINISNEDNTQSASYPINLSSSNLFDKSSVTKGYRLSTSGTSTSDPAYYISDFIKVETDTLYIKNSPSPDAYHRFCCYSSNDESTYLARSEENLIRTPATCQYIRICGLREEIDSTIVNKGNTILPYEAYYTPIELCKIGTYQDKIDKSTGKNLFDINQVNNLAQSSTIVENASYRGYTLPVKAGETYTISRKSTTSPNRFRVCFTIDKPANNVNFYNSVGTLGQYESFDDLTSGTVTVPNNMNYMFIYLSNNNETISLSMGIQIETGTFASSYEPYGTSWYVKKEIGKVVLNGSEAGWVTEAGNTGRYNLPTPNAILGSSTNNPVLSDRFQQRFAVSNYSIFLSGANHLICIIYQDITWNVETWKTWLSNNNTSIYYALATPTYETITDTTLIGQLEALKPYSYNPVTNITQTNNDAPFELDVSLSYTNTMNVNNVGNIYAKPILTIEGSGTIGIILNDIEVLSVDLGTDEKITIDVPNLQAYNPDNDVLLNRNVTGDYMKLLINDGDNTIAFSGSVTSATLTNYTRYI